MTAPDVSDDVAAAIGNTPLVRLSRLAEGLPGRLLGKCEFMNPGGSVKDRIARAMIDDAERRRLLGPGGTIVEATAGNTGMALAMIAARRGYRMVATMTTKMSADKVGLLRALGAEVIVCPYDVPPDDDRHFIRTAERLACKIPGAWHADQFANPINTRAHFETTGPEIWKQSGGAIDVFVAGIGTGGTFGGVGRYLKARNPAIRLVLADPVGSIFAGLLNHAPVAPAPYLVEGIGGDFVPGNARLDLVDNAIAIPDALAIATAHRLFRTEGIFAGASSGCVVAAALAYAQREEAAGKRIVCMLADGGRSYLSTIHDREWYEARRIAWEDADQPPRAEQAERRDHVCSRTLGDHACV